MLVYQRIHAIKCLSVGLNDGPAPQSAFPPRAGKGDKMIATGTLDNLILRRERWNVIRVVVAVCAAILLAGCYEIDTEFIDPGEAQFLPGLAGAFDDDDGGTTEITPLTWQRTPLPADPT